MEYKLPPLPFAVFDEFGKSCEDRVCDHFIAAIEAQGVSENRCITELKAYAEANPGTYIFPRWDGQRVAKYLASSPPAPQASEVQQEPVAWMWKNTKTDAEGVYLEDPATIGIELNHPAYQWTLLYTHPAQQAKPQPLSGEQETILNFLLGVSDMDGVWFGDKHPQHSGQFWWRDHLRKAFQQPAHGIKGS